MEVVHFITLDGLKATSTQVTQSEEPVRDLRICVRRAPVLYCPTIILFVPTALAWLLWAAQLEAVLLRDSPICPTPNCSLALANQLVGKTSYL